MQQALDSQPGNNNGRAASDSNRLSITLSQMVRRRVSGEPLQYIIGIWFKQIYSCVTACVDTYVLRNSTVWTA